MSFWRSAKLNRIQTGAKIKSQESVDVKIKPNSVGKDQQLPGWGPSVPVDIARKDICDADEAVTLRAEPVWGQMCQAGSAEWDSDVLAKLRVCFPLCLFEDLNVLDTHPPPTTQIHHTLHPPPPLWWNQLRICISCSFRNPKPEPFSTQTCRFLLTQLLLLDTPAEPEGVHSRTAEGTPAPLCSGTGTSAG